VARGVRAVPSSFDVPEIDATLRTVEQLGGSVVLPENEIPGMGYVAYFKDPENNVVGLWENLPGDQQAQAAG
jgi:predicted enzyme related to lactoylglutathione lyase